MWLSNYAKPQKPFVQAIVYKAIAYEAPTPAKFLIIFL